MDYQEEKRKRDEMRQLNEHNENEANKRRLVKDVEKHLRTVMIGALADFEEEFGVYWGMGQDKENLDPESLADRERWEKCRTNILNRGNAKIRLVNEEISKYIISSGKYTVNFKFN